MDSWLEHFARTAFLRSADTAHDLKTPLNVAVLNLELLRMRIRKLTGSEDDPKIANYSQSIEVELRRMARIFDTFFLLSTPPKSEGPPHELDLGAICVEAGATAGFALDPGGVRNGRAHESRIRQAYKLFFDGAANVLADEGRNGTTASDDRRFDVTVSGVPLAEDFEITKIFKFYYTDPQGNPDLSLAAARLIAETYGGELIATQERDRVSLRLSFPLGDK